MVGLRRKLSAVTDDDVWARATAAGAAEAEAEGFVKGARRNEIAWGDFALIERKTRWVKVDYAEVRHPKARFEAPLL